MGRRAGAGACTAGTPHLQPTAALLCNACHPQTQGVQCKVRGCHPGCIATPVCTHRIFCQLCFSFRPMLSTGAPSTSPHITPSRQPTQRAAWPVSCRGWVGMQGACSAGSPCQPTASGGWPVYPSEEQGLLEAGSFVQRYSCTTANHGRQLSRQSAADRTWQCACRPTHSTALACASSSGSASAAPAAC